MTMTTTDKLYPSIQEATEEDLKCDIESAYAFWLPINPSANICAALRIAAHHARRADAAEKRLAEAIEWLRWTTEGHSRQSNKPCLCSKIL
jgi:hypothetical protein